MTSSGTPAIKPTSLRRILLLCFFVSGACGLIYEIAWLRTLGLVFGNATFATSAVLAGFMAGLGLGALYFGKKMDQYGHPIRVYGFLEGGIGLYTLLTPLIWTLIGHIHTFVFQSFQVSSVSSSLIIFAISFFGMFFPTFLMGGTLPALSKYFVKESGQTANKVGTLYAFNTAGAMAGVALSGFFLIRIFGIWQSIFGTAFLNIFIFGICFYYSNSKAALKGVKPSRNSAQTSDLIQKVPTGGRFRFFLLFLFSLSGVTSMMYEVAWTRAFSIVLGSSTYAFSVMLTTFLFGIALGSWFLSTLSKNVKPNLFMFSALQILTAVFVLSGFNQFDEMPYYFIKLFTYAKGSVWAIEIGKFILCSFIMFFPTFFMGAMFTCFIHMYRRSDDIGNEVGNAYFSNTIGTILGAALTGFVFIPLVGIQKIILAGAAINVLIGLLSFVSCRSHFRQKQLTAMGGLLILVVVSSLLIDPWNITIMTGQAAIQPQRGIGLSKRNLFSTLNKRHLLYYKEGASTTVSVQKIKDDISLSINGKVDASVGDAFTQLFVGHLPMLLHTQARKVLVIGLGSGMTAAAVASYPVRKIDVVELEEAVVEGSYFFTKLNRNVLKDKRVHLIINDGRNQVRASPETYDVIISEPSNPWIAGVANLFTREFYETLAARLAPQGIACQWIHLYALNTDDLRMVINTFSQTFPHMSLWTSSGSDVMLVGSEHEITIDFNFIQEQFKQPEIRDDFQLVGIRHAEGFFSNYWLNDSALRQIAQGAAMNTDNLPLLEFSAPLSLFHNTRKKNIKYLDAFQQNKYPTLRGLEPPVSENAIFHSQLANGLLRKKMYGKAASELEIAKQIAPDNIEVLAVEGLYFIQTKQFEHAKQILLKVTKKDPNQAEAHYYLGQTFQALGDMDSAITHYKIATHRNPEHSECLMALAKAYASAQQYPLANLTFKKALPIHSDRFDVLSGIAGTYGKMGEELKQLRTLKTLIENYPKEISSYEAAGNLLQKKKAFLQAFMVYKALEEQHPYHALGPLQLARLYLQAGKFNEAKRMMQKALRYDPNLKNHPDLPRFNEVIKENT
jgi:spermidine synthase